MPRQELTAPELEFLTTAVERCPTAALVVTKTDLHQHWRRIVDTNRGHLADAGLALPVLAVSSFLRLRAAREPGLNDESGFAPLVEFWEVSWRRRSAAARPRPPTRSTSSPRSSRARPTRSEWSWPDLRTAPPSSAVLARRTNAPALSRLRPRRGSRSSPTASRTWSPTSSTTSRAAARRAARCPRHHRPVRPQGDLGRHRAWLRRQVAEAGVSNSDLLVRRAVELSDAVAERFNLEAGAGVELELDLGDPCLGRPRAAVGFDVLDARRPAAVVLVSGRLAAYVPLMALSLGPPPGCCSPPPPSSSAPVWDASCSATRGSGNGPTGRTRPAAAAGKFIDEVAFEMNKETRDGLRLTQRSLRDEFQARARSSRRPLREPSTRLAGQRCWNRRARGKRVAELEEQTGQLERIRRGGGRRRRR